MGVGSRVIVAPVTAIETCAVAVDLSPYRAVIFTSENGVAALGPGKGRRAWCVGARTAAAATALGYAARASGGTAEALVADILAAGAPGPFLHARGREARGDVAPRLRAAGRTCDEAVVYAQHAVPLTEPALDLLAGAAPVLVPLFSPNSAARLVAALPPRPAPLLLAAMSPTVAQAWNGPAPARVRIAERPGSDAMLEALEELAGAALSP